MTGTSSADFSTVLPLTVSLYIYSTHLGGGRAGNMIFCLVENSCKNLCLYSVHFIQSVISLKVP